MVNFVYIFSCYLCLQYHLLEIIANPISWNFSVFFPQEFYSLALTFRFFIHFELILYVFLKNFLNPCLRSTCTHCYIYLFISLIYLFLTVRGLHCCMWASSSCREQGLLSSCDHFSGSEAQALGLLTSVVAAQGLSSCGLETLGHTSSSNCGLWAPDCGLSSCGTWA